VIEEWGMEVHLIVSTTTEMDTSRHHVATPPPSFCYNYRKDGHRAMSCPAKKGLNLRIYGYGMPGQAFYSISMPEDEDDKLPKTFPGLLTIK
jgi:hypothetical protein